MAVKNNFRNISVLFVLGVLLLTYGGGALYVTQRVGRLACGYAVLGAAALIISFARIRNLSWRAAGVSRMPMYIMMGLLVIVWTVLYIEVNYFAFRFDRRWDLTQAKQHTISESTREVIEDLHQDILITAFYTGLPPKYLEDLLHEYQRLSVGKITSEIIDPIVQIGYAAQFGNVISGNEQKVFVRSGGERQEIDFTHEILTEEQLTNAIVRVTRKVRRAYFLIGHGESDIHDDKDSGLSAFNVLLSANHVITKRLMLGIEGTVPEDCDVLVIAGPKEFLTEKEEEIIGQYLRDGGDILILVEHVLVSTPEQPLTREELAKNPSMNSLLSDWGIKVADDVVVDLASHASGDIGSPATRNYMAHRSIVHDLDYTFFIRPRSISILPGRRRTLKVAPLILTASEEKSWGETNRTLQIKFDEGIDRAGPVPIAFAVWEPKEEGETSDTRMIVITDTDFLTNAYVGQYSNARLGINAINWLSEVDYEVLLDTKKISVQRLDLTSTQKRMVAVMLFMIPAAILSAGFLVWMRRRIA